MISFIVEKMKRELMALGDGKTVPKVIATGGLATMISEGIDCIDVVDKMLTLEGLKIIYEKNKKCRGKREVVPCELEIME